jgi:glycosyltransferase involved in cell wall biosynthesis
MSKPGTSVLIASLLRPQRLTNCLKSLASQSTRPDEVIVAWQGEDSETFRTVSRMRECVPFDLRPVHCPEPGIVPAENAALDASAGDIILLIDDDAIAPADWIARHVAHYDDPRVGAVGGPYDNFGQDGIAFPKRDIEPIGRLTWYGRPTGNMYDHVPLWQSRAPREIVHVVGNNMSVRRIAFDRMEEGLRPYWQAFEMEVCLQVKAHGYKVLFDFQNKIQHYPTSAAYSPGRSGDLQVKVYNAAYNHAFVLAKHSPSYLRPIRLGYLLGVGSVSAPGIVAVLPAISRHGNWRRELTIMFKTWDSHISGWRAGSKRRTTVSKRSAA